MCIINLIIDNKLRHLIIDVLALGVVQIMGIKHFKILISVNTKLQISIGLY